MQIRNPFLRHVKNVNPKSELLDWVRTWNCNPGQTINSSVIAWMAL